MKNSHALQQSPSSIPVKGPPNLLGHTSQHPPDLVTLVWTSQADNINCKANPIPRARPSLNSSGPLITPPHLLLSPIVPLTPKFHSPTPTPALSAPLPSRDVEISPKSGTPPTLSPIRKPTVLVKLNPRLIIIPFSTLQMLKSLMTSPITRPPISQLSPPSLTAHRTQTLWKQTLHPLAMPRRRRT